MTRERKDVTASEAKSVRLRSIYIHEIEALRETITGLEQQVAVSKQINSLGSAARHLCTATILLRQKQTILVVK